jgi:hypothetical protein
MDNNCKYKDILEECFSRYNIKLNEVLEKIEVPVDEDTALFFYTSYFEDLGNSGSDIDLYVISNHQLSRELPGKYSTCEGVSTFSLKGLEFDVEYWNPNEIIKIMDKSINNFASVDGELMKILLRLNYSYSPYDSLIAKDMISRLKHVNIEQSVTQKYALVARSIYEDALKMYKAKEYILTLDCCRYALWHSIGAFNSLNGHSNLKEKWISKIIMDNKAYGHQEILNKYLEFQIYSNVNEENIANYVEEFLEFIQELLNTISVSERN